MASPELQVPEHEDRAKRSATVANMSEKSQSISFSDKKAPLPESKPMISRKPLASATSRSSLPYEPLTLEVPEHPNNNTYSSGPPEEKGHADDDVHEMQTNNGKGPRGIRLLGHLIHLWQAELLCCLGACLLLLGLCLTLRQFDEQPQPVWPGGLTLNTIVAVLSTVSRFLVVVPVTQGLLQLKWNWFAAGQRSLRDIYFFDQASRGMWHIFGLLGRVRGRFILLCAMVTIVFTASLATSFITQSTISYVNRPVSLLDNRATVQVAKDYPTGLDLRNKTPYYPADGMLQAAKKAILYRYDQNETWPMVQPSCPTANCQWPTYNTLSICASVGNITDQVTFDSSGIKPSLPGNLTLYQTLNLTSPSTRPSGAADYTQYSLDPAPPRYKWENPDIIRASITQFVFLYQIGFSRPPVVEAAEVIFHYCVNTYNASVTNNIPSRPLLSSNVKIVSQTGNYTNFTMTDTAGTEQFKITGLLTASSIRAMLPTEITGTWDQLDATDGYSKINDNGFTSSIGLNMFGDLSELSGIQGDGRKWVGNNLQQLVDNMAEAMGESMQTRSLNNKVMGESSSSETFIVIRWEWITLLVIQIGVSIIFLIWVAIDTYVLGVPVLKSSNLGELFALQRPGYSPISQGEKTGFGHGVEKGIQGRLVREQDSWHLDVQQQDPASVKPKGNKRRTV